MGYPRKREPDERPGQHCIDDPYMVLLAAIVKCAISDYKEAKCVLAYDRMLKCLNTLNGTHFRKAKQMYIDRALYTIKEVEEFFEDSPFVYDVNIDGDYLLKMTKQ